MAFILEIFNGESLLKQYELLDGRHRLGSRSDLEVQFEHPEIDALVASIDIRGEAVFLRNFNVFPIYVGDYELGPNEQTEWRPGIPVLLTQNITLAIQSRDVNPSEREEEAKSKRKKTLNQLAIIGICVLVGGYLLYSEPSPADSTRKFAFSFNDLVQELAAQPAHDYRIIRNYLTDARMADIRWGRENPKRAITSYQLLLDEKRIREAPSTTDTTEGKIKIFALARIDDLSGLLKREP